MGLTLYIYAFGVLCLKIVYLSTYMYFGNFNDNLVIQPDENLTKINDLSCPSELPYFGI